MRFLIVFSVATVKLEIYKLLHRKTKKAPQFLEVLFLSEKRDSPPDKPFGGQGTRDPDLGKV
jgi:hypothetical protein